MLSSLLVTLSVVATVITSTQANTCAVENSAKVDCGFVGVNADSCVAKGCCWQKLASEKGVAWCYQAGAPSKGYSVQRWVPHATGITADLHVINPTPTYGTDMQQVKLHINFITEDIVQVKLVDANAERWEVPSTLIPRPRPSLHRMETLKYQIIHEENPFTLQIRRKEDNAVIFNLPSELTLKDQFLEFSLLHDTTVKTFGLGENTRTQQVLKTDHMVTLWAADIAASNFDTNLYGSYPMFVQLQDNGQAHGAMLMNSNGMDITIKSNSLQFQVIGGILDFYVFTGSNPEAVIQQYEYVVGKPAMMPYWSLGFHNCRWGYTNIQEVEDVVLNYTKAGIPLETQWVDIDHMQAYRDFTLDSVNFPVDEVASFVNKLHDNGQHFVPIVDPGIMPYAGYTAYEEGLEAQVYIKDIEGNYYLGQVWPGATNFPDFFHPNATTYWTNQLQRFHDMVAIDGVWIDMNEVSNFCNGNGNAQVCSDWNPNDCPDGCCLTCKQVDSTNKYDYPPYLINNYYDKMSIKTIAMSSQQYGDKKYYNTHNLFGLTEQIATNVAITKIRNKRPFVLSRSSFLSTGVHSAKWTGDNSATWNDLKSSIVSIMDFNLFGVPMIGADICGFNDDTTEELCARWIEVGAFYPFSRDHNTIGALPQELYRWSSVTEAAKKALGMRYQILPYMYTLFYNAHVNGGTVVRGLWNNFPSDKNVATIDTQFMIGDAVLISPVLTKGSTEVNAYFPAGLWYKFADRKLEIDASDAGKFVTLNTPLTEVNVHVRGGKILPLQDASMTIANARQTPFTLLTALCPKGKAFGSLFWDDGEQIDVKNYLEVSYEAYYTTTGGSVEGKVIHNNYNDAANVKLGSIVIMSKSMNTPKKVLFNKTPITSFTFSNNVLTVTGISATMDKSFLLQWE